MAEQVLNVTGLAARVEDKQLLHGVDLTINKGETHVLMGPIGAGKSTLGYVLMGAPKYTVTGGQILFKGEDITHESTDKRAKAGMFLSFQEPLEVPGLTLEGFIRSALQQKVGHVRYYDFKKELARCMDILQMDASYAERSLNVGFSGGEKKRNDILQMAVLEPELCILDESDSGLDIDALKVVADGVNSLRDGKRSFIIVTHYQRILDYIKPDYVHVLYQGRIVKSGDFTLVKQLEEQGYGWLTEQQ